MKFKDIKEGDKVLIPVSVPYAFGEIKVFFITRLVERTTKTQFIVNDVGYKKDTGKVVGDTHWSAEYAKPYNKSESQEQKKIEFESLVSSVSKAKSCVRQLEKKINHINIDRVDPNELDYLSTTIKDFFKNNFDEVEE